MAKPQCVPCKIGTVPMSVILDKRYPVREGRMIRWRPCMHGSKWEEARVTKVNPDGYFFAERI